MCRDTYDNLVDTRVQGHVRGPGEHGGTRVCRDIGTCEDRGDSRVRAWGLRVGGVTRRDEA